MSAKESITNYHVLVFDMANTFMFGGDKFNDSENYESVYRSFGGLKFNNSELTSLIIYIYNTLLTRYRDPEYYDKFVHVRDFLDDDTKFNNLSSNEKDIIEKVFAHFECGTVPEESRNILTELAKTHRLGLISNVWCYSRYYKDELRRSGVYDLFEIVLFSSDHGSIKPSPKLFNMAIKHFGVNPAEMIFIGDNYKRDVIGSINAGMKSVWVNLEGLLADGVKADVEIKHIRELI
jgi:HAD superfamily hydrolase (TIGR01549 family)